jgi:hypothetical protein
MVSNTRRNAAAQVCGADDTAIITHQIVERVLRDIWNTPLPPPSQPRHGSVGTTYVLRLQARPDGSSIRSLRQLLKIVGRYYGLRCIDAHEERAS